MEKNNIKRLWGIEHTSDTPERIVPINEALRKLNLPPDFSILEIAGGRGVILNGIAGLYPECKPTLTDIRPYGEWRHRLLPQIKQVVIPLQDLIKDQRFYEKWDVVMMLNSYRNWPRKSRLRGEKDELDAWLVKHAKYFITSGCGPPLSLYEQGDINGRDFKGLLQLFKLPLSKKL